MQAGLNAHLSKPVEPDALFDTLETLLGLHTVGGVQRHGGNRENK
jgi:hypothetical protein